MIRIMLEYVYRILLKYLCDLGLFNQCFKFNTKYMPNLDTETWKLFETNINQAVELYLRIMMLRSLHLQGKILSKEVLITCTVSKNF